MRRTQRARGVAASSALFSLRGLFIIALCLLGLANLVLFVWDQISSVPPVIGVRSRGYYFPPFEDAGQTIRNLAAIGAILAALTLDAVLGNALRARFSQPPSFFSRIHRSRLLVLFAIFAFIWGVYAAYPPTYWSTNFRIIWVNWITDDDKIRYLGQLLRAFFYEYPQLLQGGALALAFVAFQRMAVRVGYDELHANALALVFCLSSVFAQFYSVAEDWLIVTAFAVVPFWAYGRRNWTALILSLVALAGIRLASATIVGFAIVLIESLRTLMLSAQSSSRRLAILMFGAARLIVVAAVTTAFIYFAFLYFIRYGQGELASISRQLEPIETDGFTLTRLSGVYILHAIWSLPPALSAACVATVLFALRAARSSVGRLAMVAAFSAGGSIMFYEIIVAPQYYYNYRYLALSVGLGLPAVLYVMKFAEFRALATLAVAASLLFSHATPSFVNVALDPPSAARLAYGDLYNCRRSFAPWFDENARIYTHNRSTTVRNAVAYIGGIHGAVAGWPRLYQLQEDRGPFGDGEYLLVGAQRDMSETSERLGLTTYVNCRGWRLMGAR